MADLKGRTYRCLAWSAAAVGGVLSLIIWRALAPRGAAPATEPAVLVRQDDQQGESHPAFEPSDWTLWPVAAIYIGVIALLVISCLVLMVAYPTAMPDVPRTLRIAPPAPQLETDPHADLLRFRAAEQKRLDTYYWVDKQKGIVHIPIQQEIKKLAATGIPGFPKGQP